MSQQEEKDMAKYFYRASAADFMRIPGGPIVYSATRQTVDSFENLNSVQDFADCRAGLTTGDNTKFQREWTEISFSDIGFGKKNRKDAMASDKKWFPCSSGGSFRKWYGNHETVVNWSNDGHEIRTFAAPDGRLKASPRSLNYYFREGFTWGKISSGKFSPRYLPEGFIFDDTGQSAFPNQNEIGPYLLTSLACSKTADFFLSYISQTMSFNKGDVAKVPVPAHFPRVGSQAEGCIEITRQDWDSYEVSWNFKRVKLLPKNLKEGSLRTVYEEVRANWRDMVVELQLLEESVNGLFIEAYSLADELTPQAPKEEITLTCNPHYRYGVNRSDAEHEALLRCDTISELVSYAIGCMMGRYSLDEPGLILASQGETLQDYLCQIPSPSFAPDDDAILPLTDQEWFPDDATNRFREFVRIVWGEEHLQENLDFVAESLCLNAIKPKRGESSLDTIRRYLSTQFYKDHMRTYKKRPIYWLFSSGKHKAFECLVYLHRYNEGTLARMRTEYVIPLSAKLSAYAEKLEQDKDASSSAAETKRLEKEIATLHKQQTELAEFDEKLRHYADQRISLDLDDGVKVNYGKFGDLLAEVKAVTGENPT
jgi:type II restriction/modification system DNA methylase subunit YeeA